MSQIILPEPVTRRRKNASRSRRCSRLSPSSSSSSSQEEEEEEGFKTPTSSEDNPVATSCRDATIFANIMKQSKWRVKIGTKDNRADFDELCSLCLRQQRLGTTTENDNKLIRPCLCEGYRSRHHKRCIEEWVEQTGAIGCPFCQVRYELTRTKKSILDYVRELELHDAFKINFGMFLFSIYLFLVGLTVCYDFINTVYKCDPQNDLINRKTLARLKSWQDLEELVDCHRSTRSFDRTHVWVSISLFGFTCTGTVVLFFSIISLCLKFIVTHYLRYLLWSKTNFKVSMEPYRLVV